MISSEDLTRAISRSGHARELELPGAEAIIERWRLGLESFVSYYQAQFGEAVDPFEWWQANPLKAQAFFEPDTLNLSPQMKAAVWKILLGFEIRSLEFDYHGLSEQPRLRLELASPGEGQTQPFESHEPGDFKFLRHIGTIRVNGHLELQGYHAVAR